VRVVYEDSTAPFPRPSSSSLFQLSEEGNKERGELADLCDFQSYRSRMVYSKKCLLSYVPVEQIRGSDPQCCLNLRKHPKATRLIPLHIPCPLW